MNATELNADSWLEMVQRQVSSLDYGVVQIVVHGSRVVQIERTEKIRLGTPLRPKMEESSFARQSSGGRREKNS